MARNALYRGNKIPLFYIPVECKKQLRGHTNVSDSDSFLSVSDMKIINNFTLMWTLFIIHFLDSQRATKRLRSAKVLAVSLHLLSRLARSAVAILWDTIGEALNLSQEVVHGSQESGK